MLLYHVLLFSSQETKYNFVLKYKTLFLNAKYLKQLQKFTFGL